MKTEFCQPGYFRCLFPLLFLGQLPRKLLCPLQNQGLGCRRQLHDPIFHRPRRGY
jgi:hypothetical protein